MGFSSGMLGFRADVALEIGESQVFHPFLLEVSREYEAAEYDRVNFTSLGMMLNQEGLFTDKTVRLSLKNDGSVYAESCGGDRTHLAVPGSPTADQWLARFETPSESAARAPQIQMFQLARTLQAQQPQHRSRQALNPPRLDRATTRLERFRSSGRRRHVVPVISIRAIGPRSASTTRMFMPHCHRISVSWRLSRCGILSTPERF